jgi:hypothetical protein
MTSKKTVFSWKAYMQAGKPALPLVLPAWPSIFSPDERNAYQYTPYYLFDNELMPFFFEAIKLRYSEYDRSFALNMRFVNTPAQDNQEYVEMEH